MRLFDDVQTRALIALPLLVWRGLMRLPPWGFGAAVFVATAAFWIVVFHWRGVW